MVKSPVATKKENKDPQSSSKRKTCYVCSVSLLNSIPLSPPSIRTYISPLLAPNNSEILEDNALWPDRLLQELCRKIGLQASGEREELVTRLRLWHVSKHDGKGFQGSNFFLLPVNETTISAEYMSPFKRIEHHERRSILRKRGRSEVAFSTPPESPVKRRSNTENQRVAETSPSRRHGRKKQKGVQFSPYNRVHLISPRKAGDEAHIRQLYASIQEGAYENSEDEEEEWARTVSNASGSSTPDDDESSSN